MEGNEKTIAELKKQYQTSIFFGKYQNIDGLAYKVSEIFENYYFLNFLKKLKNNGAVIQNVSRNKEKFGFFDFWFELVGSNGQVKKFCVETKVRQLDPREKTIMIEKQKYDRLKNMINSCEVLYLNFNRDFTFNFWNLSKIKEPIWRSELRNKSTVNYGEKVMKSVGYLEKDISTFGVLPKFSVKLGLEFAKLVGENIENIDEKILTQLDEKYEILGCIYPSAEIIKDIYYERTSLL